MVRVTQRFETVKIHLTCDICGNTATIVDTQENTDGRGMIPGADYGGWRLADPNVILVPEIMGPEVSEFCPDCETTLIAAIENALEERKDWAAAYQTEDVGTEPESSLSQLTI